MATEGGRSDEASRSAQIMEKREFLVKVAGVTNKNRFNKDRQEYIRSSVRVGDALKFVRERFNKHDENAIRIDHNEADIGYVEAERAVRLSAQIDRGKVFSLTVLAINGGGADNPIRSVIVKVESYID